MAENIIPLKTELTSLAFAYSKIRQVDVRPLSWGRWLLLRWKEVSHRHSNIFFPPPRTIKGWSWRLGAAS